MSEKNTFYKGYVELLVLRILKDNDCYGLQLVKKIRDESEELINLSVGTLYPTLYKLIEKNGDCTYEELVREFGTTDSISVEYKTETISYEELNKVRKFYIHALLCSCAIMLCMFSIVFFYQKKKETSYKDISVTEDADNNGFRSEIYEVHGNECKKIEIDD